MPNYFKTKFFLITLAVLVIYSYGWKVTEINLGDLFRDFHLVKPLIKELTQPDLFSREKKSQTTEIEFFLKADLNKNQALERSNPLKKNKGEEAANAILSVLGILKNDSR